MDELTSQHNENLRALAVEDVLREGKVSVSNALAFVQEVAVKFIERQLDGFPLLCQITQAQNYLKFKELQETSKKGKYTDSYGWSESGSFKFDYEIPRELYLFMVNLVYKDFWEEANERVWRKFMKKVCDGEDAMQTLMWVKSIYGPNSQEGIVLN